ncbi:unnamed protein product [Ectocarpus sp. CCAP 1310/34]|nr:unnamed protein product [Ectocarpus sp. CCAP 1310/34]
MCAFLTLCIPDDWISGTQGKDGRGGTSAEGERLVNALTFGSLGSGTNKVYQRMWNTWKEARAGAGSGPWLRESDGVESAVRELSVFMACRCFGHKNQSQTIRRYLSAIKYFRKMHAGWELPTSHFQILAMLKTIDRVHANTQAKPKATRLSMGMLAVFSCQPGHTGNQGMYTNTARTHLVDVVNNTANDIGV